jgi:hypothetical protein
MTPKNPMIRFHNRGALQGAPSPVNFSLGLDHPWGITPLVMEKAVTTTSLTRTFGDLTSVDRLDMTNEMGQIYIRPFLPAVAPSRTRY